MKEKTHSFIESRPALEQNRIS